MANFLKKYKKKIGLVTISVGIGLLLAVFAPFWSFVMLVGVGLIAIGWYLISDSECK